MIFAFLHRIAPNPWVSDEAIQTTAKRFRSIFILIVTNRIPPTWTHETPFSSDEACTTFLFFWNFIGYEECVRFNNEAMKIFLILKFSMKCTYALAHREWAPHLNRPNHLLAAPLQNS